MMLPVKYTYGVLLFVSIACCQGPGNIKPKDQLKDIKLPPCQACKMLVHSFKKGMEKTENSNFEGGNTGWEEEKLGTYAKSEVRFVEIQEKLCTDLERGQDQCHALAEEAEQFLESWWFDHQKEFPDLISWLCIDHMKFCCPNGHYGPDCQQCLGYPDNICSNNGKCKGNGTRKGNGKCSCDDGYAGEFCDKCAPTFYESYKDETKVLCSKCHVACLGSCTQAGPKGCIACQPGWLMETDRGCIDINECLTHRTPCHLNEFCVNNEGSYTCLACDQACDGCHGDGPDMCTKCANGYVLRDNICVDKKAVNQELDSTRFFTYLGLCVATCIIFQKNPILASAIGLCVAIYVTVSEYMLGNITPQFTLGSFLSAV